MAKTVKKTEAKKPAVKIVKINLANLTLDELYTQYHTAETVEAKENYYNIIKTKL
jgi:hypothetical protein